MKKSRIKQRKRVNPKYKDRVFKFIFGNPANKEWTLSLYKGPKASGHQSCISRIADRGPRTAADC